jgi:1-deoxyxylulose-5-phosphate synthase
VDFTQPDPSLYRVPYMTNEYRDMPYRRLGDSGLRVPNVGLGTYKFGFPETGDNARVGEAEALRILDAAAESGVTLWDTANRYNEGSGNSERIIGRWFKANPKERRNIVVATKIFGGMDGRTPNHGGLSRGNILDSVSACLARLQVEHIDLLYFHRIDTETPIEESLTAIEDLVSRGVVRYFAVSGASVSQLRMFQAAEKQLSPRCRVVAVQNQYDILNGESPDWAGAYSYAANHGISFIGFFPLARGLLTSRYLDPSKCGPGDRLVDEGTLSEDTNAVSLAKVQALAVLAGKWGMEVNQVALAYMLALPGMGPVIPGCSSVAQVKSNAVAGKVKLEPEQILRISEVLNHS